MIALATHREEPEHPLGVIADALTGPRDQIETTFVATGARLSEGSAMLNRIGKVLGALAKELDSPELDEASRKLEEVGRSASDISTSFDVEQVQIERLGTAVQSAGHPISNLRRSVKMMDIIAINARVVAAGVVGDRNDFDVFTHDIAALSKGANRSIQAFTAVYEKLIVDVSRAASQHALFEAAHSRTLQSLAVGLSDALAQVASQRRIAFEGGAATREITMLIMGRIASAVMALQVGDSTRQRLEHIETGIIALHEFLEDTHADEASRSLAKSALGRLQAAQLADAADTFEAEVMEVTAALQSLAEDAGAIMEHSRAIYSAETVGTERISPLASLTAAVSKAIKILHDCEIARRQLESTAGAVLETVSTLMEHVEVVQEIEANMRLVSLNAAVKCAQLGPSGAPLNVVARLLRELTGETVLSAEDAMQRLTTAAELARSFGEAANGESTARIARLEGDAIAALALLTSVDRSLLEARRILEAEGPKTVRLLTDAAQDFSTQIAIAEYLRDQQFALVAECPPVDEVADATVGAAISAHWPRYTMDAERRIHGELFGSPTEVATPQIAAEADDLDCLMF